VCGAPRGAAAIEQRLHLVQAQACARPAAHGGDESAMWIRSHRSRGCRAGTDCRDPAGPGPKPAAASTKWLHMLPEPVRGRAASAAARRGARGAGAGAPAVSGSARYTQAAPAAATAAYSQNTPAGPSARASDRNVCATSALADQLAVTATPLARPRTCRAGASARIGAAPAGGSDRACLSQRSY